MACTNCIQTTASITGFSPSNCTSLPSCAISASCVIYSGPNLQCSGILNNDALDIILQKIDPLLCQASGDYSGYNTYCLAPISTQQEFVESISNFICLINGELSTFTGVTFPAYQTTVTGQINGVNSPGITCAIAGVTSVDNLATILTKYCSAITDLSTNLSMSEVNWSQCYTVSPTPVTISDGFNALIGQICLLKAQVATAAVLPTFNNTATCLIGGTANDSLATTMSLVISRLCQTGTLNNATLTWGCVTQPAGAQDLQTALQNILTQITVLTQAEPMTWSNDFTVTNVNDGNLCLGKHVALATPSTQDRFVAATTSDTSPGTLQAKLTAGTNITLDYTTTPGQAIINSTGGSGVGDHKVLADSGDSTADYLINKVESGTATSGVIITPTLDTTNANHLVSFQVGIDLVALFTDLLNAVSTNPTLAALFCSVVASCPSPCAAPTNVTVTYTAGSTTTTTTTTT